MKKSLLLTLMLCTLGTLYPQDQGTLFIIGGGYRDSALMQQYVSLCGGTSAPVIIIPNASEEPVETGNTYLKEFAGYGCTEVNSVYITKENANSDSVVALIEAAKGVFFSGGDQQRHTAALLGTRALEAIRKVYAAGAVLGGTSAGAAIMSKVMITGEELAPKDTSGAFLDIIAGNVETKEGFGFIDNAIVDQHFVKRRRHNRLISLIIETGLPGIGIDESTAIIVKNGIAEVTGESSVVIYDGSTIDQKGTDHRGYLNASGIRTSILVAGDRYDLNNRTVHLKNKQEQKQ